MNDTILGSLIWLLNNICISGYDNGILSSNKVITKNFITDFKDYINVFKGIHFINLFKFEGLTKDKLFQLRFQEYNIKDKTIYLVPFYYAFLFLPTNTSVISIKGEEFKFNKKTTPLIPRRGVCAFGITIK